MKKSGQFFFLGLLFCSMVSCQNELWQKLIPGAHSAKQSKPPSVITENYPPRASTFKIPAGPLLMGKAENDTFGYPQQTVNVNALRELLRQKRFAELNKHFEYFQKEFEKDFRKEYWPEQAVRAFYAANRPLGALIKEWVAQDKSGSFAPQAALGAYYTAVGFYLRGGKFAGETSDNQFADLRKYHGLAVAALAKALKKRPSLLAAYNLQLNIARGSNLLNEEKVLQAALTKCPKCFLPRLENLDNLLPRWGGSSEEMADFVEESLNLVSENPKLKQLSGAIAWDHCQLLKIKKSYVAALKDCDRAVEASGYWSHVFERAWVKNAMNDFEAALLDFELAAKSCVNCAPPLAGQAMALASLKRWDEALRKQKAAEELDDFNYYVEYARNGVADWLWREAYDLNKNGQAEQVIPLYNAAVNVAPYNAEPLYWRARHYLQLNQIDQGIKDLRQAVALSPGYFEAVQTLDYTLVRRHEFEEIIKMWTRYLEIHPQDGRAYLERSGTYHLSANRQLAYQDAMKACELKVPAACERAQSIKPQ